ncbi:LD-carboxypeptidase [bacterium]|nr:LD-carboxypeptidase [bacterium]
MIPIHHPKFDQMHDFAILSVASYFNGSSKSSWYKYCSQDDFKYFPQDVINHEGFSSNDLQRKNAIEDCFSQNRFVIASKGGYGSIRSLDACEIKENWQGIFVGFSDLTIMINHLAQHTQIACFHGPMLSYPTKWQEDSFLARSFHAFFCSEDYCYQDQFVGQFFYGNEIQGKIYGGNLSVICSMIGTPFELNLDGIVLFLEDIHEASYVVDRMLKQLSLQRDFHKLKGLVIGQFTACSVQPKDCGDLELIDLLKSYAKQWEIPLVWGAPIGHVDDFMVIPIGGDCHMVPVSDGQIRVKMGYPKNI